MDGQQHRNTCLRATRITSCALRPVMMTRLMESRWDDTCSLHPRSWRGVRLDATSDMSMAGERGGRYIDPGMHAVTITQIGEICEVRDSAMHSWHHGDSGYLDRKTVSWSRDGNAAGWQHKQTPMPRENCSRQSATMMSWKRAQPQ